MIHLGDPNFLPIFVSVNTRMGSIALVHIEDICNAHIFLMEHADAEGRYLCCARSCVAYELTELLKKVYPSLATLRLLITYIDQPKMFLELSNSFFSFVL